MESDTMVAKHGDGTKRAPSDRSIISLPVELCQCPVCAERLDFNRNPILCCNPACASHPEGFPVVDGRPALIDFTRSVIDRIGLVARQGSTTVRRHRRVDNDRRLHIRLYDAMFGSNEAASKAAAEIQRRLHALSYRPRLLIIGGGTMGSGVQPLYCDPALDVVAFDVYSSPHVQLIADAHSIPFANRTFHAVWIQAVLEHVLEPDKVVAEIHRVLAPQGLVYADTPFMQQVHEGAYDFCRYTLSGHRWLFRRFTEIASGVQGGPGVTLRWSIRYCSAGLFRSYWAGRLIEAGFFWLRFLDRLIPPTWSSDGASAVWFLGTRSDSEMSPREAIAYYQGAKR